MTSDPAKMIRLLQRTVTMLLSNMPFSGKEHLHADAVLGNILLGDPVPDRYLTDTHDLIESLSGASVLLSIMTLDNQRNPHTVPLILAAHQYAGIAAIHSACVTQREMLEADYAPSEAVNQGFRTLFSGTVLRRLSSNADDTKDATELLATFNPLDHEDRIEQEYARALEAFHEAKADYAQAEAKIRGESAEKALHDLEKIFANKGAKH